MSPEVRFTNPPELTPTPGYSHVVEVMGGHTIYVSGQVPLDASGNLVGEGDLEAQTRQVFANLEAAITAAGASFHDVIKLSLFMTDISRIPEIRPIRDGYVDTERPPASTAVEVQRLVREEFMIEIEAIAVVP